MASLKCRKLQSPRLLYSLGTRFALSEKGSHFRLQSKALRFGKLKRCVCSHHCGLKHLLAHTGQRTALRVATIVDVTLLQFADKGVAALAAPEHTAVTEDIAPGLLLSFAGEKHLHAVE